MNNEKKKKKRNMRTASVPDRKVTREVKHDYYLYEKHWKLFFPSFSYTFLSPIFFFIKSYYYYDGIDFTIISYQELYVVLFFIFF